VYATRLSDETGGVVCIDTNSKEADPFCGFTELTGKGEAPFTSNRQISGLSDPMLIGTRWYSFNFAAGTQQGSENELVCFDVSTDKACAGQPDHVTIGSGTVTTNGNEPIGETAAIAGRTIVPIEIEGASWISCYDDATQKDCAGKWPVKLGFNYVSANGAPFPLLDATGKTIGLCLPTGTDQCMNLEGETVTTPAKLPEAIPATEEWNGPAFVLGPRVYVPNGNTDQVDCFDYSTGQGCAHFPKSFQNLGLLYTVNPDPQRPTCIWVNSDDGTDQIQDFDAYTGEACGEGTIRVLASQFVVPQPQCTPASYVSLQVLKPGRSTYTSGSVAFADGDGNPIGLEERSLDATGTASLAGLELNTPTGLPEFLFTLSGEQEKIGVVEVELTWTANYDANCIGEHTTVTEPAKPVESKPTPTPTTSVATAPPAPAPKGGVLAFGTAHLASSAKACVASSSYLASVGGKHIAAVTFTLNGHRLKSLSKPNSHGAFSLRVGVKAGRVEHLSIHVTFTADASNRSLTISKTLARCAAAHHAVKPRFTG
jgi:outer membrane protein assembly factor BamB